MTFTLPNLPYAHDALGPYMSKETLEFHHDKHHQAYVTNGNNAIKGTEFEGKSLEEIVKGSFGKNAAVFNNAGQHYNHLHFWNWMKPNGGGTKLPVRLEKKINEDLGGFEKFKTDFIAAGVGQFGSGWCWVAVKGGKLEIAKTPNGESPLVHVYSPTPVDAKRIADAKLIIVNGLGFEGWLPRLVQSSGGKAKIVTATDGIAPLRLGNDADPHALTAMRDRLVEQLETAKYPVADVEVVEIGDGLSEIVATLVATAVDPNELNAVAVELQKQSGVRHATWEVSTTD